MNCFIAACLIAFAPVVPGVPDEPRPLRVQVASAEECREYADREAGNPLIRDFEGGAVIYISFGGLLLLVLLCWLLFVHEH